MNPEGQNAVPVDPAKHPLPPADPIRPELLAPAGTIASGLVAFDSGADAVYAGLPRFNARERGGNLTVDEMSRLIAYGHKIGRRVYVTLNTLLKETELAEAADIAAALADIGPDAVIVQDIGLVHMLRTCFPSLTLHGSTQMGIHNSAGAAFAASIGLRRVILERQTTFEELTAIRKNTDIELEIFVHGALCCGRSGACLFSSWLGGWSGNRGKCKQPCRRRYFSENGNGFFFSPGDLCLLDSIPFLKKAGLAGLKIEGRLRHEDYVRSVVSAYRHMLNASPDTEAAALREARALLGATTGRKWTPGFTSTAGFAEVLQHRTLGASGLLCGRVINTAPGRFVAGLSHRLFLNDRIRVQPDSGDEGPVFTVTKMDVNGRPASRAEPRQRVTIYLDTPVARNSLIYKAGLSNPDLSPRIAKLPASRLTVDLAIAVDSRGLTVSFAGGALPAWHYPLELDEARQYPLAPDILEKEFASTRSERLATGRITATVAGRLFLPAASLKEARRAFWEWMETQPDFDKLKPGRQGLTRFNAMMNTLAFPQPGRITITVQAPPGCPSPVRATFAAKPLAEADHGTWEAILPDFCSELDLAKVRDKVRFLLSQGVKRFRVTSLYGFTLLRQAQDATIITSFPLPACNSLAVRELLDHGAGRVQAWIELDSAALNALLARARSVIELYTFGRPPILATRAVTAVRGSTARTANEPGGNAGTRKPEPGRPPRHAEADRRRRRPGGPPAHDRSGEPAGRPAGAPAPTSSVDSCSITDGRGLRFEVLKTPDGLTRLYSQQAFQIPAPADVSTFMDCSRARPGDGKPATFNYAQEWK